MTFVRRLRAISACAAASGAVMVLSAHGAAAHVQPAGAPTQITVVLAAADAGGLHELAQTRGLSKGVRAQRLAAVSPSTAAHAQAVQALEDAGLTITGETTWTITAQAASSTVRRSFGYSSRSRAHSGSHTALPFRPAGLSGVASAVFDDGVTVPFHRHASVPIGPSADTLRTSYATSDGSTADGQTIATLQFSGWNPADLTSYAAAIGIADPVASGQYVGISVDRTTTRVPNDGFGDQEVALDQESLLSTAPHLKQRAYMASNTVQGEIAALHQIATDGANPAYKILAMSTSWGACEDAYLENDGSVDTQILNAETQAYDAVLAAGVTIFAASGDAGAFDCAGPGETDQVVANKPVVDTPGSFPSVISVGGTSIDFTKDVSSPLYETAWTDPANGADVFYNGDAGGGGTSQLFDRPSFQLGVNPNAQHRTVPDIAAMASPSNMFAVYWSRGGGNPWGGVGGTSLASPLSAALFSNALVDAGYTSGVGDIHALLYSSPDYSGADATFRDVTIGDVSFGKVAGIAAKAGYDLSSGLGAPQWTNLVDRLSSSISVVTGAATHTRSTPISVTGTRFTQWSVVVKTTLDPVPSCDGQTYIQGNPPTTAELIDADGLQVIYVLGRENANSPCAIAQTTTRLDGVAPSVSVTAGLASPTAFNIATKWSGNDTGSAGVTFTVTITHSLQTSPDVLLTNTSSTNQTVTGVQGRTYTISVTATDAAGNAASTSRTVDVPLDDTYLRSGGSWRTINSTNDYRNSARVSSTKGSTLSGTVTFKTLALGFASGRNNGRVDVYVDGKLRKTVDTYTSSTSYRKVVPVLSLSSTGRHSVQIKVRGDKSSASRGTTVVIDSLLLHS